MSRRRVLVFSLICGAVVVAALLAAGSRSVAVRTFALRSPNADEVAILRPGSSVCEGPVRSDGSVQTVRIWGAGVRGGSRLTAQATDAASHQSLASGTIEATGHAQAWDVPLDRAVSADRPLDVCLTEQTNAFSLSGYPAVEPAIAMSGHFTGPQPKPQAGQAFSLVLLAPPHRSFLGALSTAFSRASLWRPGWVGSWTFWLLTIAFLATFALAAVAVALAVPQGDEDPGPPRDGPGVDASPPRGDSDTEARTRSAVNR